jgi:hypothetical protein
VIDEDARQVEQAGEPADNKEDVKSFNPQHDNSSTLLIPFAPILLKGPTA